MLSGIIVEERWKPNIQPKPLEWRRSVMYALTTIAIVGLTISLTSPARAGDLVTNGDFTSLTPGTISTPPQFLGSSQIRTGVAIAGCTTGAAHVSVCGQATFPTLTGWTGNGLVWVYAPGTADTVGANSPGLTGPNNAPLTPGGPFIAGNPWKLWGPNTGVQNGLPSAGPDQTNFIAMDSDQSGKEVTTTPGPIEGRVSQLVTGLTVGLPTEVKFDFAAAQAFTFPGATNDQLLVSLCPAGGSGGASVTNPTPSGCGTAPPGPPSNPLLSMIGSNSTNGNHGNLQTTDTLAIPEHGFSGWMSETFTFTPTSTNEVLSFLAKGNPTNVPPIVLLDSVSATPIPEPGTWSLFAIGFAVVAGIAFGRRRWLRVPA